MTRLERMIVELPPFRFIRSKAKKTFPRGFEGLSLYEVWFFFIKELKNVKLNERVAASTYNFMMALPPSLLFLFSLIPYFPLKGVEDTIVSTLRLVPLSKEVSQSIEGFVRSFIHTERRDLLSFGILLVLFFSSNGMMGLMRSFDKSLHLYKTRTTLQRRWAAIKLTLLLIGVGILSIATFILQSQFINKYILMVFDTVYIVKGLSLLLLLFILFCTISIIYRYGPSLTNKFKFVSAGSILATGLIGVATTVFFFLVDNFLNYNKIYGSIGTLIAFMIWLYIITMILLIGYELNVSILIGVEEKTKKKKEVNSKTP
ncbi:MAG: YihY/virulence factor BrkB family protein [Flavipsychrobacter sp.]|nr:YihY/virulence factor BrkB family protein [Flavipsychrobacter sp.]